VAHAAVRSPGAVVLGRFGYAARGIVYGLVGMLAGETALGISTVPTDSNGAILTIYQQPFGRYLLGAVTVGLFSYALWNVVSAIFDLEKRGTDARGVGTRLSFLLVGGSYAFLGWAALELLLGSASAGGGSDSLARDWTATFLDLPYGVGLVVAAGVFILLGALVQFFIAITAEFAQRLALERAFGVTRILVRGLGRIGYVSLGIVLGIVGAFLIVAALEHNPGEAKGLGGALAAVASQPFGPVLLGIVAAGLIAYGLYSLAEGRYRRIV
jgi:hypothetical protein